LENSQQQTATINLKFKKDIFEFIRRISTKRSFHFSPKKKSMHIFKIFFCEVSRQKKSNKQQQTENLTPKSDV